MYLPQNHSPLVVIKEHGANVMKNKKIAGDKMMVTDEKRQVIY